MKTEAPVKEELITEAALRRFTHFGFNKTTFSEIAKDLGVSQQSMYYYFPDKKSLIIKVAANVMASLIAAMQEKVNTCNNLLERLTGIVEVKEAFFEKYFMLATEGTNEKDSDELHCFVRQMQSEQQAIFISAFEKAIAEGEIRQIDAAKKAALLLNALNAMQDNYRNTHIIPDHQAIRDLFEEQKELIAIYVSGLKNYHK
ncbi:MAG: TetR/AcrR family transcriptional regulator [Chitinophagaceae bacterium]|nr:TetR/AcrR family transcriptional regulator [Chitinophagaceae bacterium]